MFQDRLQALLAPAIIQAFQARFGQRPEERALGFQQTRPEFEGDVTINVFPFLKLSGKAPEPTAQAIGEELVANVPVVERFNVVKGFLNIVIADSYWLGFLNEAVEKDILAFAPTGKKVMVEYASPNTNKPLHLGHLRNIFLGYSVSRILQAAGNEVVKVQVINDRGIHICKSMLAWQKFGNGETPQSSGLKGDKLVGKYYVEFDKAYKAEIEALVANGKSKEDAEKSAPILLEAQEMLRKWEANDPEVRALWEKMNGWVYEGFDATYARAGVDFDKNYYESRAKAEYSTKNIGHYGLAFDYYTHFTSPIRRYSDVLSHRILYQNLHETIYRVDLETLEQKCKHISRQEVKAAEAERESVKYKQVEYMMAHIGDVFEAQISGMIEKGIFVQLPESGAEGLIPFANFHGHYKVDESKLRALSKITGHEYRMGDLVKVKLLDADLLSRKLEFELLDEE